MPFFPLLMETCSLTRALGCVPRALQPWLLLLSALDSFSDCILGSLTLEVVWLKCRRLILRLFLSHFIPCCHLPLDPLQLHQNEWELKSWSDFSPTGAGRSGHLFRKVCWVVSSFFFFFFFAEAKCLATLWESIQVYGSLPEGALKLFQGWIVSSAQSPCVQWCCEFASDLCTGETRLPHIPNTGEMAFSFFLIWFLELFSVCH